MNESLWMFDVNYVSKKRKFRTTNRKTTIK